MKRSLLIILLSTSCFHCCQGFSLYGLPRKIGASSFQSTSSLHSTVDDAVIATATASSPTNDATFKSRTQRIMEKTSSAAQASGAGGSSTYEAFLRADENWSRLKASKAFEYDINNLNSIQNGVPSPPTFVTDDGGKGNPKCWEKLRIQSEASTPLDYDVTVCGGTLGIFIALSLQLQGHRVAVVEAGKLMGREQEWNISMKELLELVELGVLTKEDIDQAVTTEFPGCRAGFKNKEGELQMACA